MVSPLRAVRHATALRAIARTVRDSRRPGAPGLGDRLQALPRLVSATLDGSYTGVSRGRLALIALGVGYVASPVDLVPEMFLSVLGLGDDILVGTWVAGALLEETEKFLAWEREHGRVVSGEVVPAG